MTLLGLAVVVLVVHPLWWLAGGRRPVGAGWWMVSGVAWWVVMWRLWDDGAFWLGWGSSALAVLCLAEASARARYHITAPDVIE